MGMMINRRRVMGGKKLPYDAEIEYLESSGTQYIDIGVNCTDAGFMIDMCITQFSNNPAFPTFIQVRGVNWGLIVGTPNEVRRIIIGNGQWWFTPLVGTINKDYHLEYNFLGSKSTVINDSTYSVPTYIMPSDKTIKLFAGVINNSIDSNCFYIGKLYNCKISKLSQIVLDLIPVRIDTTGYLYDKVSGQLFGNAGTGEFILGPDK